MPPLLRFRHRSVALVAFSLASALSACNNGATVGPYPAVTPTPVATSPVGTPTIISGPTKGPSTPSPSPVGQTPSPTPSPTPVATAAPTTASTTLPAGAKIYVANHGKAGGTSYNPSVTIYSATASGNVAPLAILSGANTNEAQVQFPAVDTSGDLFVSDQGASGGSTAGFVSEFLPTKLSGNQYPTSTISGLDNPEGIAFDSSGDMYVATELAINVYPPGSTSPMRTITGEFSSPYGLFVDAKNNIYVTASDIVEVFAPGATGAATPTQEFDTPDDMLDGLNSCLSIAADSTGKIYCANFNTSTIVIYPAGATGATAVPTTTITDPTLGAVDEPFGIFIDANDILYVANYGNSTVAYTSTSNALTFAASASVIKGSATFLNYPYGIYVR